MLFAHGPLGVIIGSFWRTKSKKRFILYLITGFVGGIFADIDLFYYYLVDAENSHRTFFTHTLLIPVIVFLLAILLHFLKKKARNFLLILSLAYFSHLLTDMIGSQIRIFYPLNGSFFGLADLNIPAINNNLVVVNFLIEGIIIFFFFYALLRFFVNSPYKRLILLFPLLAGLTIWSALFLLLNGHIYHSPVITYYGDTDDDQKLNYLDTDVDGDGLENIADEDADGDDKINAWEIMEEAEKFDGVWYDFTEGGWIQIPMRLGLVANTDLPRRIYESIGINLRLEMSKDYNISGDGYVSSPRDAGFTYNPLNIANWLAHQNKLEKDEELRNGRDQIGDILFFESGYLTVVTGFDNRLRAVVLDVQRTREIRERSLEEIIVWEGKVVSRGKVLP